MSIAELRLLPSLEKLKIIETLWSDVVQEDASFQSPSWHQDELRETEEAYNTGKIVALDWEDAKQQIRAQVE